VSFTSGYPLPHLIAQRTDPVVVDWPMMTHQPSSRLVGKKGAMTGPVTSSSRSSFTSTLTVWPEARLFLSCTSYCSSMFGYLHNQIGDVTSKNKDRNHPKKSAGSRSVKCSETAKRKQKTHPKIVDTKSIYRFCSSLVLWEKKLHNIYRFSTSLTTYVCQWLQKMSESERIWPDLDPNP